MGNLFKKYNADDDVPMTYHTIMHCVVLPLNILNSGAILFGVMRAANSAGYLALITTCHNLITFVLSIVIFIGFFKKTSSSWYCTMAFLAEHILFEALVLIEVLQHSPNDPYLIGGFVAQVIFYLAVILYYAKREPLFTDDPKNRTPSAESGDVSPQTEYPIADSGTSENTVSEVQTAELPAIRFCSRCGHAIEPGSRFCPNCGKKL